MRHDVMKYPTVSSMLSNIYTYPKSSFPLYLSWLSDLDPPHMCVCVPVASFIYVSSFVLLSLKISLDNLAKGI